ncbi:MAG: hypothetical protein AAB229_05375, partial [Candidatus Hydrogenedentota bacterium]
VSFEELEMNGKNNSSVAGDLRSRLVLAEAVYGFTQGGELVLRLGTSDESFRSGTAQDLGAKLDWGIGVRGIMWDSFRDWRILGDAQYFSRPTRNYGIAEITISQWQIASSVEWHLHEFYPYIGLHYEDIKLSSNNEAVFPSLETKGAIGIQLGLGYEPSVDWSLHVEARTGSSDAFTVGAHYRF